MENPSKRQFKGYEGEMVKSEITGEDRLQYNREKAFTKEIEYYDNFTATEKLEIPRAYIIPQGWWPVINLLKRNNIKMEEFPRDTIINVETYKIENFETVENAYEGHYMHKNTEVSSSIKTIKFRKGDLLVTTFQDGARYLIETLEPTAPDSFFNWNFFDTVLQQKEGFSPYVFEDRALKLLEENPDLEEEFKEKKKKDADFRNNWYNQLDWLHKKSDNYEQAHLRYPIFRLPR